MTGFAALPSADETGMTETAQWAGIAKILGPRWAQLPALTVGLVGVQLMWSVEMSYATPYLLSLGLSKSLTAIVFLAGPISGLVVQPLIGVLADNSKSRFGRRRPYMLAGVAVCALAIILLGFTRQFASILTTIGSSSNDSLTIFLAIWAIYCIDFSINAVQAVDRALLVDTVPTSEQANGNAWAACMLGIGSVAGFFIGNVDMPSVFPLLGKSELQVLSVISSILLIATHLFTASMVKERVLLASSQAKKSFRQEIRELWANARTLPYVIRQICIIQFFAWLAWFPILFYTTTYIGDLYRRSLPLTRTIGDADDAEATRLGARAQLFSSLLALATNFLAPFVVAEARRKKSRSGWLDAGEHKKRWWEGKMHLATLWALSHIVFVICMFGTFFTNSVTGATILMTLTGFSWAITQWAPFSLLAEAILTTQTEPELEDAQSILLADTRTSPAYIQEDVDEERQHFLEHGGGGGDEEAASEQSMDDNDHEMDASRHEAIMGNVGARHSWVDVSAVDGTSENEDASARVGDGRKPGLSEKAGVILGIHNIFVVVPQFLVTGFSSLIFALLEPEKSVLHIEKPASSPPMNITEAVSNSLVGELAGRQVQENGGEEMAVGPNSVAIIFRLGGASAAVAFVICWRLSQEMRRRY
ncbi:hypothetical protein EW146_g4950 [Bondarzewia mesenterica]|uniref:MFS general substrate transporter n=1 Tax=Bondarzewia mesenterica TaxID=1095465 RepID=A0A4S4LTH6_9AGAM|nr:hypothetical protein EW146_g4950 [Bondarzewia mesenterica]